MIGSETGSLDHNCQSPNYFSVLFAGNCNLVHTFIGRGILSVNG
jgi:hypothetical protein